MIRLLKITWEMGLRSIEDENVRDRIILPSWSPANHWIFNSTFKQQVKTFLMLWNRKRLQYPTLAKEIALIIVEKLAKYETKTVYYGFCWAK